MAVFPLPGLPDYSKMSATCYGILLATFLTDAERFKSLRFSWVDVPMLLWCTCPVFSSVSNDLGLYDGISQSLDQTAMWGLPYLLGRLYLSNLSGLRQLATGIFIGGLVYAPLCVLETIISPQLHRIVYGYHAANFLQQIRYGGYRPSVFTQHGLAVGVWMMAATLIGMWFWYTGTLKKVWGFRLILLVPGLLVVFIMCKSTGAYGLLALGILILFSAKWLRTPLLLLLVVAAICAYLQMGATGAITPEARDQVFVQLTKLSNEDRAGSIVFRLENEEILSEKARERMLFGWGGWGRARVYNDEGEDISVTDSLWIIAFGDRGIYGLATLTGAMLVPALLIPFRAYPARLWGHPEVAPVAVLTVIVTLFMLDSVLNAMFNPVYVLTCGALSGLAANPEPLGRKRKKKKAKTLPPAAKKQRSQQPA
ncbi:O-antigen ligase domain-containing protein [Leptolyngbya sp. AN02str]